MTKPIGLESHTYQVTWLGVLHSSYQEEKSSSLKLWGVFRVIHSNNRQPPKQTWVIISISDSQIQQGGTVVLATQAEVERDQAMAQSGKMISSTRKRQVKKRSQTSLSKSNSKKNKIARPSWRDV